MAQYHGVQHGMFHITTNARGHIPWCILQGVPEVIIDNLVMSKNIKEGQLHGFCILPDHVHIILCPGKDGLSSFMHSFKKNTSRDIHTLMGSDFRIAAATRMPSTVAAVRKPPFTMDEYDENTVIRWQKGYHDERIRTSAQYSATLAYVQGNAMKHGLTDDLLSWPWTSLHFSELLDPMEVWLD